MEKAREEKRPLLEEAWQADLPSKYRLEGPLGRGGMGEVLLATDLELRRLVALKFLRSELEQDEGARLQFLAEAQIAGQLDHPGVPPVHEAGRTPGGRLYYAMKRVRGETLAAILGRLARDPGAGREAHPLRDLVAAVARVADTLAFAHERNVIHRDVKPENIMIGAHGEVQLMDWGVAKILAAARGPGDEGRPTTVRTVLEDRGLETRFHDVKGTLVYMSPEQVMGASSHLDGRSDVYALGCTIYEIATLRPPFDPGAEDLVVEKLAGRVRAARWPAGWLHSRSLLAIAEHAMAVRPQDRHADASHLARDLQLWLETRSERARRRRVSSELAQRGKALAARYAEWHRRLREAQANLHMREAVALPWQSREEKRPLFRARSHVARMRVASQLVFEQAAHLLEAALIQHGGSRTARATLESLWRARLLDAEAAGDRADRRMAVMRLRGIGGEETREFLRGHGRLMLLSEPVEAEVWIEALGESEGILQRRQRRALGRTPVDTAALPAGSYLALLRATGRPVVRYPVLLRRGTVWRARVSMPAEEEVPRSCVLVPAGVYLATEAREPAHLKQFAIQRRPVTFMEYLRFLLDMESQEGREAALARMPRGAKHLYVQRSGEMRYRMLHTLADGDGRRALRALHGEEFEARLPVVGITYEDAKAYCAWLSAKSGGHWRLPSEAEREKAARGVDGRTFPWGETEDACLAKCRDSRPHGAFPEPVGAFPTAKSIYGMEDAAGGVWEWTTSWLDSRREERVVRGGSWLDSISRLRCSAREGRAPDYRGRDVGFRCVFPIE